MAICIVKRLDELDIGFILTPERYNPKRRQVISNAEEYIRLSDIAEIRKETITKKVMKEETKPLYIVNTGDVTEGVLTGIKDTEEILKSNKKRILNGDVIISRLRPYLRQVAYIDDLLRGISNSEILYAASTEFYVLKSRNDESIAFLVPFLLTKKVQQLFRNSVEGSQHPRFKEEDLMNLMIPKELLEQRSEMSKTIEGSIIKIREKEQIMLEGIKEIDAMLKQK